MCKENLLLTLRNNYKKTGVFHAHNEKSITRKRLFYLLNGTDYKIMTIFLDKNKVYTKFQDEKPVLYNYVANILLDRIFSRKLLPTNEPVTIIASQRETNKFLNQNFKSYLQDETLKNHNVGINISIKTPAQEKALQAVDFVSWAIFRKYEYGDDIYYNIIKDRIIEEYPLFP